MITGKQLRQARTLRGLRREDLAALFGVSLKTIGNWERGQVPPDKESLVRDRLFVESPLKGISNADLVNELLRRLPPEWFEVWGPDDPVTNGQS